MKQPRTCFFCKKELTKEDFMWEATHIPCKADFADDSELPLPNAVVIKDVKGNDAYACSSHNGVCDILR